MGHRRSKCIAVALWATLITLGASAQEAEHQYVYCDTGIHCIRAPCPSRTARDLQTGERLLGVQLDLSGLSEGQRRRSDLQTALYRGTIVLGGRTTIAKSRTGDSTVRVLLVSRIIRDATPAERSHCSFRR